MIGCPVAWAPMAKAMAAARARTGSSEAEELVDEALRIATEEGDPETASWTRGNQALLLADARRARGGAGARPGATAS